MLWSFCFKSMDRLITLLRKHFDTHGHNYMILERSNAASPSVFANKEESKGKEGTYQDLFIKDR